MKRAFAHGGGLERGLVLALVVFILSAGAVLVYSVSRQSGLEADLDGSIGDLQDVTAGLEETVDQLRTTTEDPEVLADLAAIGEQLTDVSEQLETLNQNIDEPPFEDLLPGVAGDAQSAVPQEPAAGKGFLITVWAWVVGILSLLTAAFLGYVLRRRWQRRQRRVLAIRSDLPVDRL